MNNKTPILVLIVPCFNEEEVLPQSMKAINNYLLDLKERGIISFQSYVCLVDDGSRDSTWALINQFVERNPLVKGIRLSNNFGHQNALLAGLFSEKAHADCLVTIDADLQDDLAVIEEMVEKYTQGNKIVYGVRDDRSTDSFWKRGTAQGFYRFLGFLGVKTIYNHADFRLTDSKVIGMLEKYNEVNLFLRGIFPLMGYQSDVVYYARTNRLKGSTKYPLRKMASFAWQGITSFNTSLLRMVSYTGIAMFLFSMVVAVWALVTFMEGKTIQGWTSMLLIITLFSGINMICLGLIGEYVGKIFLEVKQRPRFIIDEVAGEPNKGDGDNKGS